MTSTELKLVVPVDADRDRRPNPAVPHEPVDRDDAPTRVTEPAGTAMAIVDIHEPDSLFEPGFGRAVILGGLVGFVVVFALSYAVFAMATGAEPAVAAGASVFVGAFGGVGFGAMVTASLFG